MEGFIETLTTFQKPHTLGGNLKKKKTKMTFPFKITDKGFNNYYLN